MALAFLESEYAPAAPAAAGFHVIPVPLERTVSYGGGTAMGPEAILEASQQLEAWDGVSAPGALGIHTQAPVDCEGSVEDVLERVTRRTAFALECGAIPVTLGGEHTVSYGPIRAVAARSPRGALGVIHFDAHADLRSIYEGDRFSHACVLRRVHEDCGVRLAQFATRDYCMEERAYRHTAGIHWLDASDLARGLPEEPLPADFPRDVYVTFDVDGFDSSLMPATGTPSPGGVSWWEAMSLLERCLAGRRVVGLDVVELAPIPGLHHANFTAAKLVHALMGMAQRSRAGNCPA